MAFDIAGDLGGKLGPFPTWVWIVVGGSAVGLVLYLRKKSQSSTSTTTSGTTPLTVNPYAFGGISSGGATFPSDAGGGVTPVPAVPPAQTVTPVQTPSPTPASLTPGYRSVRVMTAPRVSSTCSRRSTARTSTLTPRSARIATRPALGQR